MVRIAPRYDPRLLDLLVALDDVHESMAEICRRVGAAADRLGITRPSYVHLSRALRELRELEENERLRREARRAVMAEAAGKMLAGLVPDPLWIRARVEQEERRRGL